MSRDRGVQRFELRRRPAVAERRDRRVEFLFLLFDDCVRGSRTFFDSADVLALVEQRPHRRRAATQFASDGDLFSVAMELLRLADQRLAALQGRLQFLFDVIESRDATFREVVDARQPQQLGLQVSQSLPRGPDPFDVRIPSQRFLNLRASRLQFG